MPSLLVGIFEKGAPVIHNFFYIDTERAQTGAGTTQRTAKEPIIQE
jgi:hypothetical protein